LLKKPIFIGVFMRKFNVKFRFSALVLTVVVEAISVSDALIAAIKECEYFVGKSLNLENVHAIIVKSVKE